jgi:hypothetical protein
MRSGAVQRYDGLVLNAVRPARPIDAAFGASYTPSCRRSARGTAGVTGGQHQTTRWPMTVLPVDIRYTWGRSRGVVPLRLAHVLLALGVTGGAGLEP